MSDNTNKDLYSSAVGVIISKSPKKTTNATYPKSSNASEHAKFIANMKKIVE